MKIALSMYLARATFVAAYALPAAAQSGFGPEQVIATDADGAQSVLAADLDGDGDQDVLSASSGDDKIAWYENTDGLGDFGPQQVITTAADGAWSVYAADLDGDGDHDVLSASRFDDKIAWYRNTDGLGAFGAQQVITTAADDSRSVRAADIDGDGDQDVLSASEDDNKIVWYENTDGLGDFGPQQVITTAISHAQSVFAADLDGDGDQDVLSASFSDSKIAWYENTDGLGAFGPQQVITTAANLALAVFAADLDGDGDVDALSASRGDNKIAWYENTDGLGSFGPQQIISTAAGGAWSVSTADLDGDGDQDVLSASESDDKVAWYENTDGFGSFGPQYVITTEADGARSVFAADIDGDGDQDVLSASQDDDTIAWHANILLEPALLTITPSSSLAALETQVDLSLPNVPDGPAELVLGSKVVPITVAAELSQALIPPLGYGSEDDVTVDGFVRWDEGGIWEQTDPLLGAFTWDVPQLVAVTPDAVPFDVDTAVTIELSQNVITDSIGVVRFGDVPESFGTWFEFGGVTLVTTVAPAQPAPGDYPIELEITSGGITEYTRVEDRALVYLGPGIESISAISGFQGGGEPVTFGLVDFEAGVPVDVYFGSAWTSGIPTGFLTASTLDVVTPLSPIAGLVDLTLQQDLGGGVIKTVVSPLAWEYLPPTVGTLSASSGPQAGGEALFVPTEGFAEGVVDVTLGGVTFAGVVTGVGPAQQVDFITQAGVAGLSDLRLVQGVFDVTVTDAYEFLAPSISALAPPGAGWYEAAAVTITGSNFAPGVSAEVQIGTDPAIPALVPDGQTATFDIFADELTGMGPQAFVFRQSGVEAASSWSVLPELAVSVTGGAASGLTLDFDVTSPFIGTASTFWSVTPLPIGVPFFGMHGVLEIGPPGGLLGVGAIGASPSLSVPVAGGLVPPGTTLFFQVLALELDGLGGLFYGFTNTEAVVVP